MDSRHDFPSPRNVKDLLDLTGRVAVVTGGAGMYGSGISAGLAEAGAKVVIASRNLDNCERKAQELRDAGGDVVAAQVDLSDEASILALGEWVEGELGRCDILFNNAVSRSTGGDISTVTPEQWDDTHAVNSTSLMLTTRTFAALMEKGGGGSVVNISSIFGMVGPHFFVYGGTDMRNPAEYAFAKGGMIALTRYLATYYAPKGIRVNCISPGGYFNAQPESFVDWYCKLTPLGRMAGEEDIKGIAVFLASDASAYITGANIPLEGGWTAW
jgi:NAD(P)-dependent dehydrogenase (short-subunit alcohol dehydrogenase family)